jgi:hypothetical protein
MSCDRADSSAARKSTALEPRNETYLAPRERELIVEYPVQRATMANSDFWRELAISFQSVFPLYEFTAYRQYYMELRYFSPTSTIVDKPPSIKSPVPSTLMVNDSRLEIPQSARDSHAL